MIYGIGIDLVENERIGKIISKWGEKFLSRIFCEGEIAYCSCYKQASIHYGARFAVKEAFLKAIGTGMGKEIKMQDIEVMNDKSGKPEIKLTGEAQTYVRKVGIEKVHVSITHTKDYASAIVVLEK